MRIMNAKRAIIALLMIGIIAVVTGCARWPEGPEPGPGETEYQLTITVEINEEGTINTDDGIYYIVLDADENPATGPGEDISLWEDSYYYIKLEGGSFYFAQNEEDSPEISLTSSSIGEKKFQATIALNDLEKPSSVDIDAVTTDSEGNNYDYLDSYFTIYNTNVLGSTGEGVSSTDLEEDKANFDIVKVTAVITTLY